MNDCMDAWMQGLFCYSDMFGNPAQGSLGRAKKQSKRGNLKHTATVNCDRACFRKMGFAG